MTRRTPVPSALLALFAAPMAWSQTAAAPTDAHAAAPARIAAAASATLAPVVVEGTADRDNYAGETTSLNKLPADLKDVPQSVTVLNKSLLQSQGATSLADALHNVPGITLGGAEGGQIGNNINLNGFTARTDIYLDGFRDRGQYYRDTFALDAVEVLMGPSSMLFGRGSTGGVINQVTKKPTLTPYTEVSGSVTTNGMVRMTADRNQPLNEQSAVRVQVMAQDGKPTTRDEMRNRDAGIAPSLKFGIGTPTEITLSALLQHNRDMPDYGVSPLNGQPVKVDRNAFYGYTSDRTDQDVVMLSATIEHKISAATTLRNQLQVNDVRVNAIETASNTLGTVSGAGFTALPATGNGTTPLSQLVVRLQSHDRTIHDKSLSNQTELTTHLETGSVKHAVLAGMELGHDTYANQAYYRNGSCNGVALNAAGATTGYVGCEALVDPAYTTSPVTTEAVGNDATSNANTVALYANDTLELNPHVKLVGGMRRDNFEARVANTVTSATTLANVTQSVHYTSTRLGAIWQPTEAQSFYASFSTSFDPSLEQLTNTTAASVLPPEKNQAYEVGGKLDLLGGKVSTNAALFQITQYNSRSQQSDGSYVATGTIRVRGARLGASGELAHGWKVFAGYAYLDASIIDAVAAGTQGKVPTNTPKNSATLWATDEFLPHWEAGGGVIYQGTRYLSNTDAVSVPGYARFDATLAYRQPHYDIRLNLFNLTNKDYYDAVIGSDGGRSVPGTGRSAMLSVTYHL